MPCQPPRRVAALPRWGLCLGLVSCGALAQDGLDDAEPAAAAVLAAVTIEAVPGDPPALAAHPLPREPGTLHGAGVRWWAHHGRAAVGLGVGTLGYAAETPRDPSEPAGAWRAPMATVTLGWRYRLPHDTALFADATHASPLAAPALAGQVNTKVGVEWQPARSRFGFEGRSLGFQLQSGYRVSLRVKRSGMGVYFRGKF